VYSCAIAIASGRSRWGSGYSSECCFGGGVGMDIDDDDDVDDDDEEEEAVLELVSIVEVDEDVSIAIYLWCEVGGSYEPVVNKCRTAKGSTRCN